MTFKPNRMTFKPNIGNEAEVRISELEKEVTLLSRLAQKQNEINKAILSYLISDDELISSRRKFIEIIISKSIKLYDDNETIQP